MEPGICSTKAEYFVEEVKKPPNKKRKRSVENGNGENGDANEQNVNFQKTGEKDSKRGPHKNCPVFKEDRTSQLCNSLINGPIENKCPLANEGEEGRNIKAPNINKKTPPTTFNGITSELEVRLHKLNYDFSKCKKILIQTGGIGVNTAAGNIQNTVLLSQEIELPTSLQKVNVTETDTNYLTTLSTDINSLLNVQIKQENDRSSSVMGENYQNVETVTETCPDYNKLFLNYMLNTMEDSLDESENSLMTTMESTEVDSFNETPAVSKCKSKCSIKNCPNMQHIGICPAFSYPRQNVLRAIWAKHSQRPNRGTIQNMKQIKICSYHFEDICLIENRLLFGAIPTLNLGLNSNDLENCAQTLASFRSFRCFVSTCQRSVQFDQIRKCSFPKGELKEKWCFNLNIQEKGVSADDWICHKHFERHVFMQNRCLKEGAVPTLMLGINAKRENLPYQNPEYVPRGEYFSQLSQTCCVASCSNTKLTEGKLLFRFPQNKRIYVKWLHNLELKNSCDVRKFYSICMDHFEPICFEKSNHLKKGSIPTLNLDKKDDLISLDETELDLGQKQFSYYFNSKILACSHPACHEKWAYVFQAPQIDGLKSKWLEYMGFDANSPEAKCKVEFCDVHFYELYQNLKKHLKEIDKKMYEKELQDLEATFAEISSRIKFLYYRCAVPECETDHAFEASKNIPLYEIPRKSENTSKWCHNCCLDYDEVKKKSNRYRICNRHFESFCRNRFHLFYWAIPTLHLPSDKPAQLFELDEDYKYGYTGKCCISRCVNANGLKLETKTRFHKFPENQDYLATWLHNANCVDKSENEPKICGLHFRSLYKINKEKLTDDAIPTENLGLFNKVLIYTKPMGHYLRKVKKNRKYPYK